MASSTVDTYLELRLLVGYLGEKEQCGWWASSFFEPSAMQFLTPVFTRTARLAQYNGVLVAARRVHDASVGVGSVFHLFRLPGEVEQDLHRRAETLKDDHPFAVNVQSKATALRRLEAMAEGDGGAGQGPLAIGKIDDFQKPSAAKRLAAQYARAFASGTRVYPYFTS